MVQISEVKGNKRDNRTAAHTHIKGLGLKLDGTAEEQAAGFVGQAEAREVSMPPNGCWFSIHTHMHTHTQHPLSYYMGFQCSAPLDLLFRLLTNVL